MASIYTHRDDNVKKTWFLMISVFIVLFAMGWSVSWFFDTYIILLVVVVFAIYLNVSGYFRGDKSVLAKTRAIPIEKSENKELWNIVENLSITAGIPMPKLHIIKEESPNAFATGRDENNSSIAVTTGLLKLLDKNEIEGVMAHEISHIKNRDILVMTVAFAVVGTIVIISDIFLRLIIYGGSSRSDNKGGGLALILVLVGVILAPIGASLIKLSISRKREYLADASGVLLTRYPEGLASALEKIKNASIPMATANHASAHLFISDPFYDQLGKSKEKKKKEKPTFFEQVEKSREMRKRKPGIFDKLYATHPPIEDRIKRLLNKEEV